METKIMTPPTKGIIIALMIIIYSLILYFTGNAFNTGLRSLQLLILLAGVIWSCIVYAKQMNANVTFGDTFAHGFKTTAVVIVITSIYIILALKVIFPDMLEQGLAEARKTMEQQNLSDSEINSRIETGKKLALPVGIGVVIIFFGITGAIGSLIGAAVAKKNPSNPFQQPNV